MLKGFSVGKNYLRLDSVSLSESTRVSPPLETQKI